MSALPRFAAADVSSRPLHVVCPAALADFKSAQGAAWASWIEAAGFSAALGECLLLPAEAGVGAALMGLGTQEARARSRFGMAKAVAQLPQGAWHLEGDLSPALAEEAALGWLLASYRFDRYRPDQKAKDVAQLKLPAGLDGAKLIAMAEGEFLTRDLINTPANDMGPDELQQAAFDLAAQHGATASAVIGEDLLAQNFPMIHAVGRAATRAPRLIELNWGNSGPKLTLVGKGVCFDTGGLDIKPSSGMLLMKKDMGGAATVLGLAHMIMALNMPIRLRVLIPSVENAIAGDAMRPRDILTSRKGLTVEVNNTDAEGRLILADALALAAEDPEAVIISMATLTGAARVAVGPDLSPYFTDAAPLAQALEVGSVAGFDPVWRLPLWKAYESMIEPGIADLDNAPSGGFAGSITAALFLRRFVDTPNYVHFDIYGHQPSDAPARPKGGVGMGARAILCALPQLLQMEA